MGDRPSGTVTFLFTDIEGSTRLWQDDPERMERALAAHDELLGDVVEAHRGALFKHTGDGVCAAFTSPTDAVAAAVAAQRGLELPVRMGLHTGEAQARDGDYFGPTLNRAARVMDAGHGGQILLSSASAALLQEPALADLGSYRLRDLAEPEHLWQMTAEGLRQGFPPLRVIDSFETNLPRQRSTFVGREAELEALGLSIGETRLITLTGVGGVGKTRLAIQAAAESLPDFEDGVWLCEFASVSDPTGLADVVASSVGIDQQDGRSLEDSIVAALRRRRALLLLDNCEHVLDGVADMVERILDECPGIVLVATSREGLAIDGERLFAVPSLGVPSAGDAAHGGAVDLFVDRARALMSGFVLDESTAPPVAEICRRLDGIPLAIELAASRVVSMTPTEIVEHLDERFRLLAGGRRRSRDRHQTLRRTVDWSYDLLDEAAQVAMRRLAVFGGSFDLEAAQAVAAGDGLDVFEVLDVVSDLVAKSLLVAEPVGSHTRYRFLETLRQYAEDRLEESGELEAASDAACDRLTGWVDAAVRGLLGPEEAAWTGRLELEMPNLRRAVDMAIDTQDAERAFGLIAPFHNCIHGAASFVDRLASSIRAALPDARHVLTPAVWTLAAEHHLNRGEYEAALALTHTADEIADGLGIPRLASTPNIRGNCRIFLGDLPAAYEALAEGERIAAAADQPHLVVANQSGVIFTGIGAGVLDPADTVEPARRLCVLADGMGALTGRAIARWTLGTALSPVSPSEALRELLEGVDLAPEGSRIEFATVSMAAKTAVVMGDTATAMSLLSGRYGAWCRDGDRTFIEMPLMIMAGAAQLNGELETAGRLLGAVHGVGMASNPFMADLIEQTTEALRATLGSDDLARLLLEGESMDFDEAADLGTAFLARSSGGA